MTTNLSSADHADPILTTAESLKTVLDEGSDSSDTENEEELVRKRTVVADEKGVKPDKGFKRLKTDRRYDRYFWPIGALTRLLGLDFAPMSIPLHRRLETFAVFLWMSIFLFAGLSATGLLIYLFFYTQYWWCSLCYLCWYIPDRGVCNRGGRRVQWMRKSKIWKHYANFFPVKVIKTVELSGDHNYIMGYHPHGILCAGAYASFATDGTDFSKLFPELTPYLLTLEVLFLIPFYREIFLCSGAVSATRASMDHLLGSEGTGRALCLVVGGAPESLDCHPHQNPVLHLNKRLGFAKMALRHGASLVPTFAFGENDIYDQIPNPPGSRVRTVQDFLQQKMGVAPCAFMGRGIFQYSFGIVPYRKPIHIVVGAPIHVDPVKKPSSEQIQALHTQYKEALLQLYNTHRQQYSSNPAATLSFV